MPTPCSLRPNPSSTNWSVRSRRAPSPWSSGTARGSPSTNGGAGPPSACAHRTRWRTRCEPPGSSASVARTCPANSTVDDLDEVLELLDSWEPPPLDRRAQARLALAAVRATGLVRPPAVPKTELRPRGRRHSPERDARSVRHHYDVSNDFFRLMLGESMTYSCALFSRGATTLEEAQEAKLELVCTKLALRSGQRVLDIGCGWGSFAIHAAANHGVQRGGHHAVRAAGRARAPARRGARPRRPRGHPGDGLPRPRRRALRRGGEHRDGRARGVEPDRRLRAPGGPAREARRTGAEPRHRPAASGRSRGGPVLGALRVPRRRTAPPVAHPARAGARRARDGARGGPPLRLRGDAQALGARTSTTTSRRPPASPARSGSACGASTCAPRGAASRAASRRSTRCAAADPKRGNPFATGGAAT